MNDNTRQEPTLVLGGTSKTGRRVAARLAARGLPVRIGSRSGAPSFDGEPEGPTGPTAQPRAARKAEGPRIGSFGGWGVRTHPKARPPELGGPSWV
jgi:hypothetical protein